MINTRDINIAMIAAVARHLGELREKVVFVGGCATGLFISDPAMPEVRATQDVDVIVEVASRQDYYRLEEELRQRGFKQDMTENAPVCRWLVDRIKVDVMPTQEEILGFSNRWYLPAIKDAVPVLLKGDLTIRLVTPPYFLATKIEAFKGRGHGGFSYAPHWPPRSVSSSTVLWMVNVYPSVAWPHLISRRRRPFSKVISIPVMQSE
jgi:hypothetical protein